MRVNPIEAVRRITAEVAAYTRQILVRREQKQTERSEQQITQTQDKAINFDQFLEKVPAFQPVKPGYVQQVTRPEPIGFKVSAFTAEASTASSQRLSSAQKAYELSMIDQNMTTIEPFDSRA